MRGWAGKSCFEEKSDETCPRITHFSESPAGVPSEPTYRLIPLMPRLTALSLSAVPILSKLTIYDGKAAP